MATQPAAADVAVPAGPPRVTARVGPPVELAYDDVDADTQRIMSAIVDLLPPEARLRRTPTEQGVTPHLPGELPR